LTNLIVNFLEYKPLTVERIGEYSFCQEIRGIFHAPVCTWFWTSSSILDARPILPSKKSFSPALKGLSGEI
jgi:hypothetical protein